MTGNRQGSEGAKVTPVFESQEAEWDDDEQNGFLVHVPAEEKRGIAAKRHGCNKGLPRGLEEKFDKTDLDMVRITRGSGVGLRTIWKNNVNPNVTLGVTLGNTANDVVPTSPRVALLTAAESTVMPSLGATVRTLASVSRYHRKYTVPYISSRSVKAYIAQKFGAQ